MLSVLIPVFNFDVVDLVHELNRQCVLSGFDCEIILIDDGSQESYKKINRPLQKLPIVRYSEEPENNGRSKIRNKLAAQSENNYFLFLDCDSEIDNKSYINRYLSFCKGDVVVCGGRKYHNKLPDDSNLHLRWLHGKEREEYSAKERSFQPNKSFMSNNFLISRKFFEKIKFNEDIVEYGHEDTLFGYELKKYNIEIFHIDNPLIHINLESNKEFLDKTIKGINNLQFILHLNGHEPLLVKDIKLLKYFKIVEKIGLKPMLARYFRNNRKKLEEKLIKKPGLFYYDIYKLGYLCTIE